MAVDRSRLTRQTSNDCSTLARAILYKLSLVGITYELTNK